MLSLTVQDLPALNAILNTLAFCFIVSAIIAIKKGNIPLHKRCMLTATFISALFLTSYSIYHYYVGSVAFTGVGLIRVVYFTILIPHIILAAVQVPLILFTLYFALSSKISKHRRLAKWTTPIWLFVSVTGVIIYLMLYHMV